jgi:peptidoglycan/LPS O-acetylase OafA/YrhL
MGARSGAWDCGKIEETLAWQAMKTAERHVGVKSGYLPTLDGWRAVAILWVLENHGQVWRWHGISNQWLQATGNRGVGLFFALSGLLICTRLLREEQRAGAISLKSFYVRRVFRIQPAALTYLGVAALLMALGLIQRGWGGEAGALLMVRNFYPVKTGTWSTAHFWSLSVEEHFYLLLPGFLVLCRRGRMRWLAALWAVLQVWRQVVFNHLGLQGHAMVIDLRTDMAIDGIVLGTIAALALQRERVMAAAKRYLVPWVALLYTAAVFVGDTLHQSRVNHTLLISVYPLVLVATMLHPEALTSRVLEWAPLRFVGRISFSVYLWQQMFFYPFAVPAPGSFQANVPLCWLATFVCATASYYLIETPLVRYGHGLAKRFDRPVERVGEVVAA